MPWHQGESRQAGRQRGLMLAQACIHLAAHRRPCITAHPPPRRIKAQRMPHDGKPATEVVELGAGSSPDAAYAVRTPGGQAGAGSLAAAGGAGGGSMQHAACTRELLLLLPLLLLPLLLPPLLLPLLLLPPLLLPLVPLPLLPLPLPLFHALVPGGGGARLLLFPLPTCRALLCRMPRSGRARRLRLRCSTGRSSTGGTSQTQPAAQVGGQGGMQLVHTHLCRRRNVIAGLCRCHGSCIWPHAPHAPSLQCPRTCPCCSGPRRPRARRR